MRTVAVASLLLLICGTAIAQVPRVAVYTDESGTDCSLVDDFSGILSVYVVVDGGDGVRAVQFRAARPDCFVATWVGDENVYPVSIGDSQNGIAIAFRGCLPTPQHVLTINYAVSGSTLPCCLYTLEPAPNTTGIEFVDCDLDLVVGASLAHTINGDETCFCGINPAPDVPHTPEPAHDVGEVPVTAVMSWVSGDPMGDPLTYDVYFGRSLTPPLVASDQQDNTYDPDILEFGADYYWQVVVKDDKGNAVPGPVWRFNTARSSPAQLRVSSTLNYCGLVTDDTVRVHVDVVDAAAGIASGSFDIDFDPALLAFVRCDKGTLTADWQVSCVDNGGSVRIEGIGSDPILLGTSGRFVTLLFVSDCCSRNEPVSSDMCVENIAGDLRPLFPVCGTFTCGDFLPDGDITGDGTVTPRDALCTMRAYLSFPAPPPSGCATDGWDVRADVDCSADITPADALCVLHSWLDGSCAFCTGSGASVWQSAEPQLRVHNIVRNGEVVRVALSLRANAALDAFGFDVSYPPKSLELMGIDRGAFIEDFENVSHGFLRPGRVRVGGYTTRPAIADDAELLVLRFRVLKTDRDGRIVIDRGVDDLAGIGTITATLDGQDAPGLAGLRLYQNVPNPFNPKTEIQYRIPGDAGAVPVTLSIYDVGGRRVRMLLRSSRPPGLHSERWNGRDDAGHTVPSGVYFYVLHAGSQTLQRKMVLLK